MNMAAAEFGQIPMSQSLAATLARASDAAHAIGSAEVGVEHVLLSLCHDPDAEAVMTASRIDVARLQQETAQYLGAQPSSPASGKLGVASELTRILEAAAAAARGSRRRDINGAIVLAAIVGDGKSVAAQILQAHGLTFDEAIRALQAALAPGARDIVPDGRPADDVLARARERVQSRSAPSLREIMSEPSSRPALAPPMAGTEASATSAAAPAFDRPVEPVPPYVPMAEPVPTQAPERARGSPDTSISASMHGPSSASQASEFERHSTVELTRPAPIATPPPIPQAPVSQSYGSAPVQSHGALPPYPPMQSPGQDWAAMRAPSPMPMPLPQRQAQPGGGVGAHYPAAAQQQPIPELARPSTPVPMAAPGPLQAPDTARRQKPRAETGQLAENIPRSMRVGTTERVEVRIAKASVKALTEGLDGSGVAWRHEITVTQAMSVRMRAPEGGFFIETVSPETQWIENNLGFGSDEYASWRFQITPQSRGWARLQIVVSARTIGADGMAAETALPDQIVDVKVRTNYKRTLLRWTGWVFAAIAGGALAKFGEGALELVLKFVR